MKAIEQNLEDGRIQAIVFDEDDGEIISVELIRAPIWNEETDMEQAEQAVLEYFEEAREKHTVGGWRAAR